MIYWRSLLIYAGGIVSSPKTTRCARSTDRCDAPAADARCIIAYFGPCHVPSARALIAERQARLDREMHEATLQAMREIVGATVEADTPVAEGAHDGLWFVAYAAPCGALDVMTYRYRRDGAAVDLGACAWCGRVRDGRWSGVVGEPRAAVLASAWRWIQASVARI